MPKRWKNGCLHQGQGLNQNFGDYPVVQYIPVGWLFVKLSKSWDLDEIFELYCRMAVQRLQNWKGLEVAWMCDWAHELGPFRLQNKKWVPSSKEHYIAQANFLLHTYGMDLSWYLRITVSIAQNQVMKKPPTYLWNKKRKNEWVSDHCDTPFWFLKLTGSFV